ncbi:response regulator transcription factor [Terrimonas sp. NA20]|uniref:Response regulator transcription factor n=1 Tax=Terrimonas ginsenosidimutans TaxID=2908004 RepID=A0ABS9KNN9_9BACT|nr:response regulator transcription factor [Terrimonas ginsenosidimutans]MCG2613921.1 response regulator transcription factor [Terrimonas ginsenosidimutans]
MKIIRMPENKYKVALVDDHVLLRRGLAALVDSFDEFSVIFQADNGEQMQQKINSDDLPDLVLLDINMPKMDGYASALWLKQKYPLIKIMALSMYDNENAVIRMFKAGAKGYILKDCEPQELRSALLSIMERGYYYSELVTGKLIHSINKLEEDNDIRNMTQLNDREIQFLKLVCTEMTYKEIAEQMFLSPRTIDGYRDALFDKLNIKTRVGLVMYAIKNGFVNV